MMVRKRKEEEEERGGRGKRRKRKRRRRRRRRGGCNYSRRCREEGCCRREHPRRESACVCIRSLLGDSGDGLRDVNGLMPPSLLMLPSVSTLFVVVDDVDNDDDECVDDEG
jgi:hypothetical protein